MIVIIDYGIGNIGSVANALSKLEIENRISSDPGIIAKATGLILPGVGAAGQGMENLKKRNLISVIKNAAISNKPILGICLGMQLLFDESEEGNVKCLGIFNGTVKKYKKERKVPQIGWNQVKYQKSSRSSRDKNQNYKLKIKNLSRDIPDGSFFYFVNSYYCDPKDKSIVSGTSNYGEQFASLISKDNIVATQFHPEKSGRAGFILLKNFFKYYVN